VVSGVVDIDHELVVVTRADETVLYSATREEERKRERSVRTREVSERVDVCGG
jgi:hypothetical protein